MNRKKLENYELTGSIHTLEIHSPYAIGTTDHAINNCVASSMNKNRLGVEYGKMIVNPNKLNGDVFSLDDFGEAMQTILAGAGVDDFYVNRLDFRLDSYDTRHYQQYSKLYRYLILAMASTYKMKNAYRTTNLWSGRQLSLAAKSDYFQIENYDRARKSEITGNIHEKAASRLELRSIGRQWRYINKRKAGDSFDWMLQSIVREFGQQWIDRLKKAAEHLKDVQQQCNDALEQDYYRESAKGRSLKDFVIANQNRIFTMDQLVDFLARLEDVNEPATRAKSFKRNYKIEFISDSDIRKAISEIERAIMQFFNRNMH